MAQGEPRAGATIIPVTINTKLLAALDATLPSPKQRSKAIEKILRRDILAKRLEGQVSDADLDDVLAMVE